MSATSRTDINDITIETRVPGYHADTHHEVGVRYVIAHATYEDGEETTRSLGSVSTVRRSGRTFVRYDPASWRSAGYVLVPSLHHAVRAAVDIEELRP